MRSPKLRARVLPNTTAEHNSPAPQPDTPGNTATPDLSAAAGPGLSPPHNAVASVILAGDVAMEAAVWRRAADATSSSERGASKPSNPSCMAVQVPVLNTPHPLTHHYGDAAPRGSRPAPAAAASAPYIPPATHGSRVAEHGAPKNGHHGDTDGADGDDEDRYNNFDIILFLAFLPAYRCYQPCRSMRSTARRCRSVMVL